MQLRRRARIAPALGLFTAELFGATVGHAQTAPERQPPPPAEASIDDTESDLGKTRVDASVLYYHEAGGRVRATEPVASVTVNDEDGGVFGLKLTADILTGATPNGTTPSRFEQAYVKGDSLTGASALVVKPGVLPIDPAFRDRRYAADASYSFLAASDTRLTLGGAVSRETDYRSYSVSLGLAQTFNNKNTTAGVSVNFEHDTSKPITGTPPPLQAIDGIAGNTGNETKTVKNLVAGITQVINRNWLFQINYSFGRAVGYQTDPYRLISVVDPRTGDPGQYLYESRPEKRTRHSVYIGNKIALGSQVLDISGRLYKDSWGIKSITLQAADRLPLTRAVYIEPMVRYYRQSAADFFAYYILSNEKLPQFASADVRLGKFDALTFALKLGLKIGRANEVYVRGEYYKQMGDKRPAAAPGYLATANLFSGVKAATVMVGYSFAF